jgi:hypothetical protein
MVIVISVMEITPIMPLVLVVRPPSLMARIIKHDAVARKCGAVDGECRG